MFLLCHQLQDSSEQYTTEKLEAAADELESVPMTVDEVTFGGDITAITSAMKEAVSQVEEHVHDIAPAMETAAEGQTDGVHLAHRVNNVSLFVVSYYHYDADNDMIIIIIITFFTIFTIYLLFIF